jgi:hypothetical protein
LLLEFELELELEFELELLLELELEFELWLELELLLEFELWLELELLLAFELWLELWLELELELRFELEFVLELELVLELWLELVFERPGWARRRLIVRRLRTARARHHSIGLPSILRSTTTRGAAAFFAGTRAAWSWMGAAVACSASDRAESGSSAEPTAKPRAPIAPA